MIIEPERDDNRIFWYITGGILLSFIIGWLLVQKHDYEGTLCREKGGVYVAAKYENICLKKDIVIK